MDYQETLYEIQALRDKFEKGSEKRRLADIFVKVAEEHVDDHERKIQETLDVFLNQLRRMQ